MQHSGRALALPPSPLRVRQVLRHAACLRSCQPLASQRGGTICLVGWSPACIPHESCDMRHAHTPAARQAEVNTRILERERAMLLAMGIQVRAAWGGRACATSACRMHTPVCATPGHACTPPCVPPQDTPAHTHVCRPRTRLHTPMCATLGRGPWALTCQGHPGVAVVQPARHPGGGLLRGANVQGLRGLYQQTTSPRTHALLTRASVLSHSASASQCINHAVNQSMHQPVSQSTSQCINQSNSQAVHTCQHVRRLELQPGHPVGRCRSTPSPGPSLKAA